MAGALTLGLLVLAFVVDLGYAFAVRSQLQNAADAAAHAAVADLDGTSAGMETARASAVAWAAANTAGGEPVVLDPVDDVHFGYWDDARGGFVESANPLYVDTVAISARGHAPGFFAPLVFGVSELDATASTTVQGGGVGEVGCYLPLAIPSCLVQRRSGGACNAELTFAPMRDKDVAWARIDATQRPNAAWLRSQLDTCVDAGASVGETLQIENGSVVSALRTVRDRIEASPWMWVLRWGPLPAQMAASAVDPLQYGRVLSGPVAVFESDDCSGGPWPRTETVIGFAHVVVWDVSVGRGATLKARVLCDEEVGAVGGGIAGTGYRAAPRFRQ